MKHEKNSLLKVIGMDIAGVSCILLVPFLGPLPGPGGIPLLLTGLGLLSVNHEFAKNWLRYVKKHSDSIREIAFPPLLWAMRLWDFAALILLAGGTYVNFTADWWLLKGLSIGVMASSSTIFMLNRNRIARLDNKLRRKQKDS